VGAVFNRDYPGNRGRRPLPPTIDYNLNNIEFPEVSYEVFGLSEPEAGLEAAPAGSRPATSRMCIELSRQELPFLDDEHDDEDEQENNDNNPFKFRPKNDDIITIAFHFNHK
jgi:hypothetical protein